MYGKRNLYQGVENKNPSVLYVRNRWATEILERISFSEQAAE